MDYGEILRSSWRITWENKSLWWLGLFAATAGTGGGGGGGGGSSNLTSEDFATLRDGVIDPSQAFQRFLDSLSGLLPYILAALAVLMLVGLVFAVLQVAARGGLAVEVANAEHGLPVSASAGWRRGFSAWWRVAIAQAIVALPGLLVALVVSVWLFLTIAVPLYRGGSPGFGGLVAGGLALVPVILLLVPVSIVLGVVFDLGLRFVMFDGLGSWDALVAGWRLLTSRLKDVVLTWLVVLGCSIGFGVLVAVAATIVVVMTAIPVALVIPAALDSASWVPLWGAIAAAGLVLLLLAIAVAIVSAAFSTFVSAIWTLSWERLTGRVVPQPRPQPAVSPHIGGQQ